MAKSYLNNTELNALIQQLSNKIKSHTSGSITDTNGVLDNPNNFATILAIVDHVKNITDDLDSKTQEVAEDLDDFKNENIAYYESSGEETIIPDNGAILVPITETITSLTAEKGRYYRFDQEVNTLAITLPTITNNTTVQTVVFYFTIGTTPAVTITSTAVSGGTAPDVYYQDGFELEAGKTYEVNALFNGSAWIVAAVEIFVPPMNIITYSASAKLAETTETSTGGLHTNAFSGTSGQLTITSHIFENGIGIIEFDGDVTGIGQSAFRSCSSLTSINIPSSVISIDNYAFYGCSGLTSVTIPDSVTSIGGSAFYACIGLTSVTIGSGVTSIGIQVFSNCTGLTSVIIGSGVTSIGIAAFQSCTGLTSITIPSSVTNIGSNTFQGCTGLTSVIIGSGVTSIGATAFIGCSGLTSITCNAMTAPTIKSDTFQNVKTGGTLTVPSGSTGYDVWMGTGYYYLGMYNWTKVEQ